MTAARQVDELRRVPARLQPNWFDYRLYSPAMCDAGPGTGLRAIAIG